jgi:hypothetical protein
VSKFGEVVSAGSRVQLYHGAVEVPGGDEALLFGSDSKEQDVDAMYSEQLKQWREKEQVGVVSWRLVSSRLVSTTALHFPAVFVSYRHWLLVLRRPMCSHHAAHLGVITNDL